MRSTVLVDTGFLIALFDRTDTLHESAKQMLAALVRDRRTTLVSVWPTLVETCLFLDPRGKCALLQWIERGAMRLRPIEIGDLAAVSGVIACFAEHNVDLAELGRHHLVARARHEVALLVGVDVDGVVDFGPDLQ